VSVKGALNSACSHTSQAAPPAVELSEGQRLLRHCTSCRRAGPECLSVCCQRPPRAHGWQLGYKRSNHSLLCNTQCTPPCCLRCLLAWLCSPVQGSCQVRDNACVLRPFVQAVCGKYPVGLPSPLVSICSWAPNTIRRVCFHCLTSPSGASSSPGAQRCSSMLPHPCGMCMRCLLLLRNIDFSGMWGSGLLQTCLLHGVWMVSLWSSSQNVHHLVCPCEIAVLCGSQ
jgi:hypothetical protein